MSSSVPEPWGKYFSKSKQAWYYHNKVTKASFFTEDGLPDGWAFIWEGNNRKYFNIITNQRVNSKNEIPQGQSQQQQQSQLQVPLQFITTTTTTTTNSAVITQNQSQTIEDTPQISALRDEYILNIRENFADFIELNGSFTGDSNLARMVNKNGAFKGLANLYISWIFNQKHDEGDIGEDPLLPSVANIDMKYLPKELVEAGFPQSKAVEATTLLTNESKKYVLKLKEERNKTDASSIIYKYNDDILKQKIRYDDELSFVFLDFVDGSNALKISKRYYDKLCQMYKRYEEKHANNVDGTKNQMLKRLYNVLQRYESLSAGATGYQMALTEDVFDQLNALYGVQHECFASPLNAYFPKYCSLFHDTDKYFGSYGSFFNFFPKEGSFESNPPSIEATMARNVQHITHLLSHSNLPLSFIIIVPGWDDNDCESYKLSISSPYLRQHVILSEKKHQYKSGAQHRIDDINRYKDANIRTFAFIMQNDAGAKKWPATDDKRNILMKTFEIKSKARNSEGHMTMWQSKSGSLLTVNNATFSTNNNTLKRKRAVETTTQSHNNSDSSIDNNNNNKVAITAEDHYNNKKLRAARSNRANRENHSLTFWYKFSNWCKQSLIQGHSFQGQNNAISVLDLACGHGGDIFKFKRLNNVVNYVGADIAKESLLQAVEKIASANLPFSVRFGKATLGTDMLSGKESTLDVFNSKSNRWTQNEELIQPTEKFHLASMQFAFHYMMKSEETLHTFFKSFAPHLIDGHFFVATTTDASTMAQELAQQPPTNLETGETDICIYDNKNRLNCKITFSKETRDLLLRSSNNNDKSSSFGMTIHFELTEHRDDGTGEAISAVNATEWLIPIEVVKQIAAEYNLQLVMNTRFDQFLYQFGRNNSTFGPLLSKMGVSGLREHEWKLARFYTCLAFKKVSNLNRIAIIVPFRDLHVAQHRAKHLQQFVPYMINYLSQSSTTFKIFIIEQSNDGKKFNRGKLLNTGYEIAQAEGYTTFIYHDVDLLPSIELLPWYTAIPEQPIHIARVWNRYNANASYCGGIISYSKADFLRINGFPNNFWGWGGEDDEMWQRMQDLGIRMQAPNQGNVTDLEYMTMKEKSALFKKQKDGDRDNKWKCMVKNELLEEHKDTWRNNGLNTLKYTVKKKTSLHSSNLAEKITVNLPLNNHWSDTKTEYGDNNNIKKKTNGGNAKSQWAGAGTSKNKNNNSSGSNNNNSNNESMDSEMTQLSNVTEHSDGIPTVRTLKQLKALCTCLGKARKRVAGGIIRDRKLFAYMEKIATEGTLNDDEIYSKLHEFYWKDKEKPKESQAELNSGTYGGKNFDRFGDRANTIKELIEDSIQLSQGTIADGDESVGSSKKKVIRRGAGRKRNKKQKVTKKATVSNLLDVGCAEGGITANVGRALGLDPKNVHGCDVREVEKEDDGFQFLLYDGVGLPKRSYPDNSFDVVTCLMALHHMVLQSDIVQSIYEVLKPGGICIIREHDCSEDASNFDGEIAVAIDIQHSMYARVLSNPPEWPTFCADYYAKYRSRDDWTNMFTSVGFEHVKDARPDLYKAHGSSNWYWAVYRK